ncbi:hypothetical protein UA3_02458 [Enterococcus faecium EnGen0263]|uniref:O-antigen ligase family protein n=1 Tax=Enterococcus faecium TaxID=1352 RepID=UPI00032F8F01|nr:O-antigen ligase family protein [Enterococcus faecium]EOH52930.1 hypothetical protein UA3_02458 [Enterococcus faecium EnGen0263]
MLEDESKQKSTKILLYFVGVFPIIDFINGVFLSEGVSIPIGSLYRIGLFVILLLLFINDKKLIGSSFGILFILSMTAFLLILAVQTIYFDNSYSILFNDTSAITKYLLWFLLALLFSKISEREITNLFIFIDVLFVIGLIIPYFLGLGNFTYANSNAGYKSFFYATNDLTYVFVILCTILLFYLIQCFTKKEWSNLFMFSILYLANCYCLLLIGTKTGIVYSVASLLITVLYLLFFKSDIPFQIKFLLSQIILVGSIFSLFWGKNLFSDMIQGTIDRITYFYDLYDGNWVKILSSSRSIYFEDAVTNFVNYPQNHWIFLFGFGVENRWSFFGRAGGYIEMDFLDTFFSYGAIGIIIFLLPITYLAYRIFKNRLFNKYAFLLLVTLGFAATSGHVFYSAMSATILGLIASRLLREEI